MHTAIVGTQWGDEGKGKVVDVFAPNFNVVARYQGGPNAGHTIKFGGVETITHELTSGICHPGVISLNAAGMIISLEDLVEEIEGLKEQGRFKGELVLHDRIHLILPYAKALEAERERIMHRGTTRRGISTTYEYKSIAQAVVRGWPRRAVRCRPGTSRARC